MSRPIRRLREVFRPTAIRPRRRARRPARLAIEALEDRTAPGTSTGGLIAAAVDESPVDPLGSVTVFATMLEPPVVEGLSDQAEANTEGTPLPSSWPEVNASDPEEVLPVPAQAADQGAGQANLDPSAAMVAATADPGEDEVLAAALSLWVPEDTDALSDPQASPSAAPTALPEPSVLPAPGEGDGTTSMPSALPGAPAAGPLSGGGDAQGVLLQPTGGGFAGPLLSPPPGGGAMVSVIASDDRASEPGTDTGQFTFTRTGGTLSSALTVSYSVSGTATNGADYQTLPGSVTFAPNVSTVNVAVLPLDDTQVEWSETVIVTLTSGNYTIAPPGTATVTIADDDQPTFNWTVTPAPASQVSNPGPQSSTEGDSVSLSISATGGPLTFGAVNLPAGLHIDSSTGLISGTVDYRAAEDFDGNYSVTVIATNDLGGTGTVSIPWTISDRPQPPQLTSPGNQTNAQGDAVELQLNASDPDGDSLTFGATGLPAGLSIDDRTGLLEGTISPDAARTTPYSVTVTADDGTSATSLTFDWTVTATNHSPVLANPGDQVHAAGEEVFLPLSAADADLNPLTFTAVGLPGGLAIDPATGEISGTPADSAASNMPYPVTLRVSDGMTSAAQNFQWTIRYVRLDNPGDQDNLNGDSVSLPISAHNAAGLPLTFSATGLPPGLAINGATGVISGTIAADAARPEPYTVSLTASDGTSSSSTTFRWNVSTVYVAPPGDRTSLGGDGVSLAIEAHYHGAGALSYTAAGLPSGLAINPSTGVISGTINPGAARPEPYTVTVTASGGASSSSQVFNWSVLDRVVLDPVPDLASAAGDSVSLPLEARTGGPGTLSFTATGLPPGLGINSSTGVIAGTIAAGADVSSPYAVTVTVTDGTASASQSFGWEVSHVGLDDPGPQTSAEGALVSFALHGRDTGEPIEYAVQGLPPGLTLDAATGMITGTVAAGASSNSPYLVTASASAGGHTTSQTFQWTVTQVGVVPPGDQTNGEGSTVTLPIQAQGSGAAPTFSAAGLPPGLSIDPSTGVIAGTIAMGAAGLYVVTVAATNGSTSNRESFNWTVTSPVTLADLSDQASVEADTVSLQVSASGPGTLTYSAEGLPPGLSINSGTGLISGTVATGASGIAPSTVRITASNGTSSDSRVFLWDVTHSNNQAPFLVSPGLLSNTMGDVVELALNAGDPDDTMLVFSASGLPPGLSLDPAAGVIEGRLGNAAFGPTAYPVTVTVSDRYGASASQTFEWAVRAPVLSGTGVSFSAVEGTSFTEVTVAQLDSLPEDATIDWGDGTSDDSVLASSDGQYFVLGSHTYTRSGTFSVKVGLSAGDLAQTTITSQANVSEAALQVSPFALNTLLTGASTTVPVATFTDANPYDAAGDYSATVDWGNGSTSPGTVSGLGGRFLVSAAPPYVQHGTYTVSVTVHDKDGASVTGTTTATVGDVYAGLGAHITVGTFAGDPAVPPSQYSAQINWGDGVVGPGQVTGSGGMLSVTGDHTYAMSNQYSVVVTITDSHGNVRTDSKTVQVVAQPVTLYQSKFAATVGESAANVLVGILVNPNQNNPPPGSPLIDWGDGSASLGTLTGSRGLFELWGSHAYVFPGAFPIFATVAFAVPGPMPVLAVAAVRAAPAEKVEVDPVTSRTRLDRDSPVNAIINPAGVLLLTDDTVNKMADPTKELAHVKITKMPPDLDQQKIYWTQKPDPKGGEPGGTVTFYKLKDGQRKYFSSVFGTEVYLFGDKEGRVLLQVRKVVGEKANRATDPVLETYELDVVKDQVIYCRVNLMKGKTGGGTEATADQAEDHIAIANIYLRQVGLRLKPARDKVTSDGAQAVPGKTGFFTVTVDKSLVEQVDTDNFRNADRAIGINSRKLLTQINYIGSFRGNRAAGLNAWRPGNFTGTRITVNYRITVDVGSADHTMKLNRAQTVPDKPDVYGILISNKAGDPGKASEQQYFANVIAHELGHELALLHRDPPRGDPNPDGLDQPKDKNLMDTGLVDTPPFGARPEDLDLIQLIAARKSKVIL